MERLLAWCETEKPDLLGLQETKVRDDEFPLAALRAAGYEAAIWGQPTYNGVAVLSRSAVEATARGLRDGGDDSEARFLDVRACGVRMLCCYVPNGREPGTEHFARKLEWFARLRRYLETHCDPSEPLVLCGDMNVAPGDIDVYDPVALHGQLHCHPDERAALARVLDWGLTDTLRYLHPNERIFSWWDYRQLSFPKNLGLRIDHVFGTRSIIDRLHEAGVDRNARKGKLPSDHAPVWISLD